MAESRSHGFPYIEPPRHDEQPAGVPDAEQADASQERKQGGNGIAPGSKLVPAMGGKARKGRTKLTHEVPADLPVSDTLKRRARYARRRMCTELARSVGAGECGMIASLFVKLGVEDMAMREHAMSKGNIALAKALGESSRMHLLYGRETAAKDALARKAPGAKGQLPSYIEVVPDGQELKK